MHGLISEVPEVRSPPNISLLNKTEENPAEAAWKNLAKRIEEVAPDLLEEFPLLQGSLPFPSAQSLTELSADEAVKKIGNAAREILGYGLKTLSILDADMHRVSDIIEGLNKQSKQIVDLQKKFTKVSNGKGVPITDELRAALDTLKTLGIDLPLAGAKELSADTLTSIKTALDGMKSELQTETQKHVMTIQQKTQQYNSIVDSLKIIHRHYSNLISTILQHLAR